MDYKKIGAGLGVFAVVVLAGTAIVSAASSSGDFRGMPNKMNNENRAQMDQAIESGNYQTFKELVGDNGRISEVVTEENFSKFIEMHNLMKEGKFEEAKVIRQELGLSEIRGRFHGGIKNGERSDFLDRNGDGRCDNLDVREN